MCFISLESVQPKLKRCASQKIVIIDKIWKSLSYCQLSNYVSVLTFLRYVYFYEQRAKMF